MDLLEQYDVVGAARRIRSVARITPMVGSPALSELAGVPVVLKLENLQATGSFKIRGAANCILSLSHAQRARGVVACSSGNHGRAVAYIGETVGLNTVICVPSWVDPAKSAAIARHGAEVVVAGDTYDEAEIHARRLSAERGLAFVDPFDDPAVIAGQGTIGLELLDQMPSLEVAVIPVSGGGLIAGVALGLRSGGRSVRIVGVSAERARVMYESVKAGRPISMPEPSTIASALSGGIGEQNHHTFRLVRDHVDEHVLVSDDEIAGAIQFAATRHHLVLEGGGAVSLAAVLGNKLRLAGPAAVVISGGNIDTHRLCQILAQKSPLA